MSMIELTSIESTISECCTELTCSLLYFTFSAKTETIHEFSDSEFYKNFKPHILNRLQVKSTNVAGTTVKVKQLHHSHKDTAVRAYVLENFLSAYECDALSAAHDSHVTQTSKLNPLLCFDSVKTFRQNLKEVGLKIQVGSVDFLEGTTCINESLSLLLRRHGMKWSYSTSFYPGESKFSLTVEERIKQATGMAPENGGKFQITSYPLNVGAYMIDLFRLFDVYITLSFFIHISSLLCLNLSRLFPVPVL